METNIKNLMIEFDNSWKEVEILINMAEEVAPESVSYNEEKYNSLCRASVVLICARNEGFVKDLINAYFSDINENILFSDVKETFLINSFTNYFDNVDKFKKFFTEVLYRFDVKLNPEEFLNSNDDREVKGKNITTSYITKISKKIGYDNLLKSLDLSMFKTPFNNNLSETLTLYNNTLSYIINNAEFFPYQYKLDDYRIVLSIKGEGVLWQNFLDDLIINRHKIAHGAEYSNPVTHQKLKEYMVKSKIFNLALVISLTYHYHYNR